MNVSDLPAIDHFEDEKNEIMNFLQLKDKYGLARSVLTYSKEDFLKQYPDTDSNYERYKHFVEVFNKRADLSYCEFAELLRNEYGYILDEIKAQKSAKDSKNIRTIRNILVFFTWLWCIGAVVTIILLLATK